MLVRGHACSRKGVEQVPVEELYPHDLGGEDRQQLSQLQGACDVLAEDTACLLAATMAGMIRDDFLDANTSCRLADDQRSPRLSGGTPVQGLGFPDGPVPDDGGRL